jgi:hypothetical protein
VHACPQKVRAAKHGGLNRGARRCVRCAAIFERPQDVPVDDETHCLINCQEPVLAWHRLQLESQIRRWHPHAALNSVQGLFTAVEEAGKKCLVRQLMGFVARCYRVARCCHENHAHGRQVLRYSVFLH